MTVNGNKAQAQRVAKKNKMFTIDEASAFLGYSRASLAKWRVQGKGPAYYKGKGGMVFYKRADLEKFKQTEELVRVDTETASA